MRKGRSFDLNAATWKVAHEFGVTFSEARALLGKRGAAARTARRRIVSQARQNEERRKLA